MGLRQNRMSQTSTLEIGRNHPILEILRYQDLLIMLTWRDIRIKYKQSVMGFMWAIFMPMLIISAGVLVKFAFAKLGQNEVGWHEITSVSVKSLPWALFVSSIRFSTNCLIGNKNLVTKIYFPKIIFPMASILSQLFDFCLASIVLIIVFTVARVGVSVYLLWVPVLLLTLLVFIAGLGILLSALNLFFSAPSSV